MNRKTGLMLLAGFLGLALLVAGSAVFHFWLFTRLPGSPSREIRQLTIQPGMSGPRVAQLLYDHGVVANAQEFYLLCWLRRSLGKLQAGEYAFMPLSAPDQILDQIIHGRVIVCSATLPEGATIRDMAKVLAQRGIIPEAEFIKLATDRESIGALGLDVPTLEGYLFPETYTFSRPINGAQIVKAMVRQFWRHLPPDWRQRAEELGYSLNDIVILASIVEKEAVIDSERSIIAAVFYNRLKLNMPLQSDPTAVYDLPDFTGPVTAAQLKRQSPYNTYLKKGLPVGPICNPGAKSLRAAFYPEDVRYIYFVSNNDGSHYFSETLSEHHKAVTRYQEKRKAMQEGESSNRAAPSVPTEDRPPQAAGGSESASTTTGEAP